MPEKTRYVHGAPSWVDIASTDLEATKAFYTQLFGWDTIDAGPVEETGGYGMFTKGGKLIAGFGPHSQEAIDQGQAPTWTTYLAVDDADKVTAAASQHGGSVVVEPMDVMTAGRMAFIADPTGGLVGIWQAGEHKGAELRDEHGALCWNELLTPDPTTAADFYTTVFGQQAQAMDMGGFDYTLLTVGEEQVAGIQGLQDPLPAGWSTVFAVDDCDATAARAAELGGKVLTEPNDIPVGRVACLADPQGVTFQIITLAEPS